MRVTTEIACCLAQGTIIEGEAEEVWALVPSPPELGLRCRNCSTSQQPWSFASSYSCECGESIGSLGGNEAKPLRRYASDQRVENSRLTLG
jgi:hypothetical protein